jgi:hypothetical protein
MLRRQVSLSRTCDKMKKSGRRNGSSQKQCFRVTTIIANNATRFFEQREKRTASEIDNIKSCVQLCASARKGPGRRAGSTDSEELFGADPAGRDVHGFHREDGKGVSPVWKYRVVSGSDLPKLSYCRRA